MIIQFPYVPVKNENMCTNITLSKRKKRSEHNIVVEDTGDDGKQWDTKDPYYRMSEPDKEPRMNSDIFDETDITVTHHGRHKGPNANHKKETTQLTGIKPLSDELSNSDDRNYLKKLRHSKITHSKEKESKPGRRKNKTSLKMKERKSHNTASSKRTDFDENDDGDEFYETVSNKNVQEPIKEQGTPQTDYAVYEIGQPELWYTVHVQLFEKLSTPEGKTVWNDLTKGEQARYLVLF